MTKSQTLVWQKVIAYTLLSTVIIGSFLPPKEMSYLNLPGSDKLHHATAYMTLALAFLIPRRQDALSSWWPIILSIWVMGAVIEPLQPIFGRDCDFFDFVANTVGIALAVTGLVIWQSKRAASMQ